MYLCVRILFPYKNILSFEISYFSPQAFYCSFTSQTPLLDFWSYFASRLSLTDSLIPHNEENTSLYLVYCFSFNCSVLFYILLDLSIPFNAVHMSELPCFNFMLGVFFLHLMDDYACLLAIFTFLSRSGCFHVRLCMPRLSLRCNALPCLCLEIPSSTLGMICDNGWFIFIVSHN